VQSVYRPGACIGLGVRLGDRCMVQNYALVYEPADVADGVFIGPTVVFTTDEFPRAVTPDGELKTEDDWTMVVVRVGEGAAIGSPLGLRGAGHHRAVGFGGRRFHRDQ
jgi:UDP-2-acetamido-3-amino-2,3-dideoxy-glucuronate N-acetyltransferase